MGCGASFCKSTLPPEAPHHLSGDTLPNGGDTNVNSAQAGRGSISSGCACLPPSDSNQEGSTPMSSDDSESCCDEVNMVGTYYQRRTGEADRKAWKTVEALARGTEEMVDDLEPIDWNGMWSSVASRVLKLMEQAELLEGEDVEAAAGGLFVTELANDTHYFPLELIFRDSNKVDDAVRLMRKLSYLNEAFLNTVASIVATPGFKDDGAAVGAGVYCRALRADSEQHHMAKAEVKRATDRFACVIEIEPGVVVWASALLGKGVEITAAAPRLHRGRVREHLLVFRNADTCHEGCVLRGGQDIEWDWTDIPVESQAIIGPARVEAVARPDSNTDFTMSTFPYALRVSIPEKSCPSPDICRRCGEALSSELAQGGSYMQVCGAALKDLGLGPSAVPFLVALELLEFREGCRSVEVRFLYNKLVPWCVYMVARACKYTARRYMNKLPSVNGSRRRLTYSEALFCVLFNTAWDGRFSATTDDTAAIASSLYVSLAVMLSVAGDEAPPAALVLGLALLDPPELLRAMSWELRMVLPEATVEKTLFRRRGRRPALYQTVEGAVLEPDSKYMIELQAMLRPSRIYTVRPRTCKGVGESSRLSVKVHESLGIGWINERFSGMPLEPLLVACCLPSPFTLPSSRMAYCRMRLLLQGAWYIARKAGTPGMIACFTNLSRSVSAIHPSDPEMLAGLWCTKGSLACGSNSPELSSMQFLQALAMLVSRAGYGDPRARLGQGERIAAWLAWRLGQYAYAKGSVLKVEKYGDIFRACGEAARDGINFDPPRVDTGPILDRAETARGLPSAPLTEEEVDELLVSTISKGDVERLPWALDLSRPYTVLSFQKTARRKPVLTVSSNHTGAPVLSDAQEVTRGTCFGFGSNDREQLGVRSTKEAASTVTWTPRPSRLMCMKERRLVDISAGDGVSAAVCDEGRLYVWGSLSQEVSIPRLPRGVVVESVSCAAAAVVALSEDGRLWQIGDLTSSPTSSRVGGGGAGNGVVELSLGDGPAAAAVSCGSYHAIAIDGYGHLWAWGRGEGGQLGIDNVEGYYDVKNECIVSRPMKVGGAIISSTCFTSVSCGEAHSAAVTAGGQLYSWGWGEFGQLGLGFSADTFPPGEGGNGCRSPTPLLVAIGTDRDGFVSTVSCGGAFTACLTTLGDVWVWGSNESGQLALPPGDPMELTRPRKVTNIPPGKRFKSISCGFAHVLAIDSQGQVYSWGSDCYGQLGLLNTSSQQRGAWVAKAPPRRSRQTCEYVPSVVSAISAVRMGACAAGYGHSLLLSDPNLGDGSSSRRRSEASSISRFG